MLRLRQRFLFTVFCFLIAVPAAFAQTASVTREDQIMAAAPSISGQTGLFETVTADTLHHGDLSFGIYYNDYDLEAGPAPLSLRPPSARDPTAVHADIREGYVSEEFSRRHYPHAFEE